MGNISLETRKSYEQTRAFALVCLFNLQHSREIFPVFLTKDRFISMSFQVKIQLFEKITV